MTKYMKTLAVAGIATLLLAGCGDDDDDSAGPFGTQAGETPQLELEPSDAGTSGAAGGDNQAFCDWFVNSGPIPSNWDPAEAAAQTPPAEIADAFGAIVGGDSDLSLQSEVTVWVTDNCF